MGSLLRHDLRCLRSCQLLGGVDEAGRGALAGPVVAGAVFVDERVLRSSFVKRKLRAVNDSKQLAVELREELFVLIEQVRDRGDLRAAAGTATVEEIARLNILGATRLAMCRALEAACPEGVRLPASESESSLFATGVDDGLRIRLLLDGRPMRPFPFLHEAVVQGDGASFAIAAASIIAKVTRDRAMRAWDKVFPHYGFAEHKGYGTPAHRAALVQHGPCPLHRALFLRKILEGQQPALEDQEELAV